MDAVGELEWITKEVRRYGLRASHLGAQASLPASSPIAFRSRLEACAPRANALQAGSIHSISPAVSHASRQQIRREIRFLGKEPYNRRNCRLGIARNNMKIANTVLLVSALALCTIAPGEAAKKTPFTGAWVSTQYTNGRIFNLKLQQEDQQLIGWEGKLPASTDQLQPDLKGSIKGKTAEVEVSHRRGYKAHVRLNLQGDKLVWHLVDADNRSNRYFPIASTLNKQADDVPSESAAIQNKSGDQLLFDILAHAESLDSAATGEGNSPSPYFSAYKALLSHETKADDAAVQSLLKCSSASGRLYAALLAWDNNHEAGLDAFKQLAADQAPVDYKSGCEVLKTTVSEVAKSFLERGKYLDFPSKSY